MRYELTDFEWAAIRPFLPNKPRGVPRVSDRRVLDGIFWVLRSGAPWRDLPVSFRPRTTCYNRFVRWRRAGVWDRIMNALSADHDAAVQMIDTSIVRVHQHGACVACNQRQSMGRSRGGLTSKIHAVVDRLNIGYSLIADIRKRMLDGETADVIILSRPVMDELDKQGKFASGSITNIAGTPVALAVRAGAPNPDISTVDALKRTLLAAKSIVYADRAKGGAAGVYFAQVVDRLGIADQLKSKTILVPGAQAPELVAKGEAEIGVAQTSEIVPIAGAQVLGPLPGEFASTTLFTAGIGATTKVPDVAKSLIQFLTGPVARPVFSAKGFQPG